MRRVKRKIKRLIGLLLILLIIAGAGGREYLSSAPTLKEFSEEVFQTGIRSLQNLVNSVVPEGLTADGSGGSGQTGGSVLTGPQAAPGADGEQSGGPQRVSSPGQEQQDTSFQIHFIDVGQADAALVLCDGEAMLIDGGNREDSDLIYSYLEKQGISHLNVVVCTHAHEDHVGGLSGALHYASVDKVYAPVVSYESKVFQNFLKCLDEQGVSITVPSPGDTFTLGSADAEILGPVSSSDNLNNTSIVLRLRYGNTFFLFTGDAEREEEQDILETGRTLESTVLKVGHHGSDTSTSYPFLREIMPQYAVISVGKGNSYGHPSEEVLSRLRDAGAQVLRTDQEGDIICVSDGEKVTFSP